MNTKDVLNYATGHLKHLSGHVFDLLTIEKPISIEAAINLSKIISKLSPLLGNLIEFNTVEFLNDQKEYKNIGKWKRQDPGFPDTIFQGSISPIPGFEIKAWFPLATEITARFKDSQRHFTNDQTYVCIPAWLPDKLIYGKPTIIDVCVVSGLSVAKARDKHYHNPPDYLVLEPEDTTARTRNLQQTNTNGYKWQDASNNFRVAEELVTSWGKNAKAYEPTEEYQAHIRDLQSRFRYRLDTNFAKMDRIGHTEIEAFKSRVLKTHFNGMMIGDWVSVLCGDDEAKIKGALKKYLDITEVDIEEILQEPAVVQKRNK